VIPKIAFALLQAVQPVSEVFHLPAHYAVLGPSHHDDLGMDPKREGSHHGDEQDACRLPRSRADTGLPQARRQDNQSDAYGEQSGRLGQGFPGGAGNSANLLPETERSHWVRPHVHRSGLARGR
jgi:hypothetical protein